MSDNPGNQEENIDKFLNNDNSNEDNDSLYKPLKLLRSCTIENPFITACSDL